MLSFKEYIINEYKNKAPGYVAVEFKFSHSNNTKIDHKSGRTIRNELIKVFIKFVDKSMNVLFSTIITFENNVLPKRLHKGFINISPKELENKFNFARREICIEIMNEYNEKLSEMNNKINNLKQYSGISGSIIPHEFKGEIIRIVEDDENPKIRKYYM